MARTGLWQAGLHARTDIFTLTSDSSLRTYDANPARAPARNWHEPTLGFKLTQFRGNFHISGPSAELWEFFRDSFPAIRTPYLNKKGRGPGKTQSCEKSPAAQGYRFGEEARSGSKIDGRQSIERNNLRKEEQRIGQRGEPGGSGTRPQGTNLNLIGMKQSARECNLWMTNAVMRCGSEKSSFFTSCLWDLFFQSAVLNRRLPGMVVLGTNERPLTYTKTDCPRSAILLRKGPQPVEGKQKGKDWPIAPQHSNFRTLSIIPSVHPRSEDLLNLCYSLNALTSKSRALGSGHWGLCFIDGESRSQFGRGSSGSSVNLGEWCCGLVCQKWDGFSNQISRSTRMPVAQVLALLLGRSSRRKIWAIISSNFKQ